MGITIGHMYVRRSIFIEASAARVWQEFESSERVKRWLNLGHTVHIFEPQAGGMVEMSVDVQGVPRHFGGEVLVYEPERELTFENQWAPPHSWTVPTFWTMRLTPLYGGTQVEMFHHGFERLGSDAADNLEGYEDGWDMKHLQALRAIIES